MAEKKPTNQEKVKEIVKGIEDGIRALFQSEQYADYLRTMSRFHNYSYRNTLLIHMQRPDATLVAGFVKWKKQFRRYVKKGEKGITILAPAPFKKKIERQKVDPDTQKPVLDADGNIVTEEKVVEIPVFRPVKVFDVKQTEGEPLPSLSSDLTGSVQQYEAFMEALRRTSPVPIEIRSIEVTMDGYFSPAHQKIAVREGMSEIQTVCTAVHEITHAVLHNQEQKQQTASAGTEGTEPVKPKDEQTQEVEAESVAYAVCQYFGIETSANSLGYIAAWSSGKELPELKASLETISKTADFLITNIDRHFTEICKEHDIITKEESVSENTLLDQYPMPDQAYSKKSADRDFAYLEGYLLPLSRERAVALMEKDFSVYSIVNEYSQMIFDLDELNQSPSDAIFAIPTGEWEASPEFRQAVADRMNHQEEREKAFLNHDGDCFAIYQLRYDESTSNLVYESLERIRQAGKNPEKENYELAYTGELGAEQNAGILNALWEKFNIAHPADYCRPSLSVSDIIALKQDGVISCYYVDRFGFTVLPDFFQPENYLKSAEMSMEDDFNMIDCIINNDPKELEKQKKSVLKKLKTPPGQEPKQFVPSKRAERER